jgi:hypothetical protein
MNERPRVDDEEVVKVAVSKVYDRLVEWLDDDDERKERQFTSCIQYKYGVDPSEVMKELNDFHSWIVGVHNESRLELLEIIEDCQHEMYLAREEAEKKWVKDNNIKVLYKEDTPVKFKDNYDRGITTKGLIVKVYPDTAKYVVALSEDEIWDKCGPIVCQENIVEVKV